jgi:endogenous inhibitor of DNA gyrase (YacG/DUF329 family)
MIKICPTCNKEYKTRNSKQIHCSQTCYWSSNIVPLTSSICPSCSKSFEWKRRSHPEKYCSRDCAYEGIRKNFARVCEQCGGEFPVNWTNSKRKYCSDKCSASSSDTRVTQNCQVCGKDVLVRVGEIKNGRGKYCSNHCRYNGTPHSGHTFGKGGKRLDLDNIYFRSSWEANFARYLNHLKSIFFVKDWSFEKEVFDLGTVRYIPDFRVESINGTISYHEVKGYMTKRAQEKIDKFKELHPEKHLVLVDETRYKTLHENYSKVIPNWELEGHYNG